MFEEITLKLEEDILKFSEYFLQFRLNLDPRIDTLKESILSQKLSKESLALLTNMKSCQIRVDKDIQAFNKLLSENKQYKNKKDWFISNRNLNDFLQTCESVFEDYDKFLRKDIKLLKETFEKLKESITILDQKIKEYNQHAFFKFVEISEDFDTLNKVVILGYKITELDKISFDDFKKKYKEVDNSFLKYLKFLSVPLDKKEEYKWLDLLENYFGTFELEDFKSVIYPKL